MYDWTKQAEEMVNSWTNAQQNMWKNWLDMAQNPPAQPMNPQQIWQQSIATWEKSVNNTLNAQNEWSEIWVENFSNIANVPEEALAMVKQAQAVQQNFRNTQQQLWQKWFELAKKMEPAMTMGGFDEEAKKAFQTWQNATQNMMKAQSEWMSAFNNNSAT